MFSRMFSKSKSRYNHEAFAIYTRICAVYNLCIYFLSTVSPHRHQTSAYIYVQYLSDMCYIIIYC